MSTVTNSIVSTGREITKSGRKLVRSKKGMLFIATQIDTTSWQVFKSSDQGVSWNQIISVTESVNDVGIDTIGEEIHVVVSLTTNKIYHYRFNNVGTMLNPVQLVADKTSSSSLTLTGRVAISSNLAETEINAFFEARDTTYSSAYNMNHVKGVISKDGTVVWGDTNRRTATDTSGSDTRYPTTINGFNDFPITFYSQNYSGYSFLKALIFNGTTFNNRSVYTASTYLHEGLTGIYVPQNSDNLVSGRIWSAWHGKDSITTNKFNIFTSFSDDKGITWSVPIKQTTSSLYDQKNASMTVDVKGVVFLMWDSFNGTTTQTAFKTFDGKWSETKIIDGDGYTNVTVLEDKTGRLGMDSPPPMIRQSSSGIRYSGTFYTGPTVSPLSTFMGNKMDKTILPYTINNETDSKIETVIEKLNGEVINSYSNPVNLSQLFSIPKEKWDALKFYVPNTVDITVIDDHGMKKTEEYQFIKILSNDSSILENAKAARDSKERTLQSRQLISSQLNLPTEASFSDISRRLEENKSIEVKRLPYYNVPVTSGSTVPDTWTLLDVPIVVEGLIIFANTSTTFGQWYPSVNRSGLMIYDGTILGLTVTQTDRTLKIVSTNRAALSSGVLFTIVLFGR